MEDIENRGFIKKNAIWMIVLIALLVFGFMLFKGWDKVLNEGIDGMVTVTGNFSCLPLADSSASPEEVCTLGVRSSEGKYYALDVSRIQDANTDLKAEDNIAVTGTLRPEGDIAGSEWSIYEIDGIIQVNTLLRTR